MRAVYKCEDNPTLSLSADTFNPLYEYDEDKVTGKPVKHLLGRTPIQSYSIQFNNGLAVVTDPEDIKALREYIKRRKDNFIVEVSE